MIFFFKKNSYLTVLGLSYGILVPQPGIEAGPAALRVRSPSHWTTREVPVICLSHKHDCTVGPVIPPST